MKDANNYYKVSESFLNKTEKGLFIVLLEKIKNACLYITKMKVKLAYSFQDLLFCNSITSIFMSCISNLFPCM